VHAIPSLVRVSAENVVPIDPPADEVQPLILQSVELDLSPALIPNMDEIEKRVVEIVRSG
jgi:hypothetical protein